MKVKTKAIILGAAAVVGSCLLFANGRHSVTNSVLDEPKTPVVKTTYTSTPAVQPVDFETAAASWIYGGGAHHTAFSQAVTMEMVEDFSEMAGVEFLIIDEKTSVRDFKKELRNNEVYYGLNSGFVS